MRQYDMGAPQGGILSPALFNTNINIYELYSDLINDEKQITFVWFPGHVGIVANP